MNKNILLEFSVKTKMSMQGNTTAWQSAYCSKARYQVPWLPELPLGWPPRVSFSAPCAVVGAAGKGRGQIAASGMISENYQIMLSYWILIIPFCNVLMPSNLRSHCARRSLLIFSSSMRAQSLFLASFALPGPTWCRRASKQLVWALNDCQREASSYLSCDKPKFLLTAWTATLKTL